MSASFKTPPELLVELGARISRLRIAKELTQAELASRAGVSPRALGDLERGKGSSLVTYVSVLKALDALSSLDALAPAPTISPMALLRTRQAQPRRAPRRRG
ncbi:helix-turn-helix transcriptional regulator [Lysobacter sp. cf310]|uniref:helix-turn-helix transcriptional regulator n=1 Tax=Lysobacter sp. cf310 TaxID=1761790 RepID=UPI0008EA8D14|nr:helix-turn-helix transcriptional regulator [Lysobacter sp. cf310]SFL30761.1 transcriptional regulator, XRE family [Lysobacter sp. cf310]